MNKSFFDYFAILAGLLTFLCLPLTFHPTLTPSLMHPSGVNWLAASAFMNSVLLIFASAQAGYMVKDKNSQLSYVKNRITAPLSVVALLTVSIFALWKSVVAVTEAKAMILLGQMGMFDNISLTFLLLSALLLLITCTYCAALAYQNYKNWKGHHEAKRT